MSFSVAFSASADSDTQYELDFFNSGRLFRRNNSGVVYSPPASSFSNVPSVSLSSNLITPSQPGGTASFGSVCNFSYLLDNSSVPLNFNSLGSRFTLSFDFYLVFDSAFSEFQYSSLTVDRLWCSYSVSDAFSNTPVLDLPLIFGHGVDYDISVSDFDDVTQSCHVIFDVSFDWSDSFGSSDYYFLGLELGCKNALLSDSSGHRPSFSFSLVSVSGIYDTDPLGEPDVPDTPNDVQQGLIYEEQQNQQAYQDALGDADTSSFDLGSFATSFGRLFNGLNYQGTDFHFMFPGSGVVPALNMQLWPEIEIPFRQWIDRMPAAWLTIARFLAWFGLAWAFIHKIRALIQDINGGDEE